jgi:Phosphotransferase enzyme family
MSSGSPSGGPDSMVQERSGPVAAAVALGARHGLVTPEARILKDGSNLIVHLHPHPVVVRVATFTALVRGDPWPFLEREVAVAGPLAAMGALVAGPSPLLPPGPHEIDGWAMTAWAFLDHVPEGVPDPVAALAALDALHAAMATVRPTVEMPYLNPAVGDLDLAISAAARWNLLERAQAADIRRERDELVGRIADLAGERQVLHGDAFAANARITEAGVVWLDLEDTCSGPVLWDDATLLRREPDAELGALLTVRHGAEALGFGLRLRGLQARVWTMLHDARAAGRMPAGT